MAQPHDNQQDPTAAGKAIERAVRDGHKQGVDRVSLEAVIDKALSLSDVEKQRLRRLVGELHGDAPVLEPAGQASRRRLGPVAPVPASAPVPPQNVEAEESVLGAAMISPGAIVACREILSADGREFYRDSHAVIWRAVLALHDKGGAVDAITLVDELEERRSRDGKSTQLEEVGGRVRIHELAALVPATANVGHYARIVVETAQLRGLIRAGGEIARLGWERPGDTSDLLEQARTIVETAATPTLELRVRERLVPGGAFILDQTDELLAVWGDDDGQIAWAAGEGLMVAGPQGVGKTTVMQQLALARCGLRSSVLGMTVAPDAQRVLYIAADRPRQAQRSLGRMVAEHNRAELDERLVVHKGPPDTLVDHDPRVLTRLAQRAGATTVFVDSLKDVALSLTDEETAAKVNLAVQYAIADGIEICLGHHQRKSSADNKKPNKLDDVYGNQRITSGLGSVLLLWGEPGDVLVELRHLKQPSEELGPWNLEHDHARGLTTRVKQVDLIDLVYRASADGLTAAAAAELVLQKETPSRAEIAKVRARLDRLADSGRVNKIAGDPNRYVYDFNGAA